jgi:DNA modification methylase
MPLQQIKLPVDVGGIELPSTYQTSLGAAFLGDSLELLERLPDNSINLVFTSPPFALQREKEYGSFVLDLGGAYEKGKPVRSLYNFRIPIHFCDEIGFFLAEDFYWFNPSKLPSPIEWVNKRKIRAKDSINTVWWFSKTEFPKSDVTKVLTEYSARMKKLLEDPGKFYEAKKRPSGHDISKAFGKDNGGAIPSNLLQIPNTDSNGQYLRGCKALSLKAHPARFPSKLPEFFIRFLTDPGDLVVDIFAGSNTTGFVAERENRRWLAFDNELQYLATSSFRFMPEDATDADLNLVYQQVMAGQITEIIPNSRQLALLEKTGGFHI